MIKECKVISVIGNIATATYGEVTVQVPARLVYGNSVDIEYRNGVYVAVPHTEVSDNRGQEVIEKPKKKTTRKSRKSSDSSDK